MTEKDFLGPWKVRDLPEVSENVSGIVNKIGNDVWVSVVISFLPRKGFVGRYLKSLCNSEPPVRVIGLRVENKRMAKFLLRLGFIKTKINLPIIPSLEVDAYVYTPEGL